MPAKGSVGHVHGPLDYFFDSLPVATTNRTITKIPATGQIHIHPPAHPLIQPFRLLQGPPERG